MMNLWTLLISSVLLLTACTEKVYVPVGCPYIRTPYVVDNNVSRLRAVQDYYYKSISEYNIEFALKKDYK